MTQFAYKLKTIHGKKESGKIESKTPKQASHLLQSQGHVLLSLRTISPWEKKLRTLLRLDRQGIDQLAFFKALSMSLSSGIDLVNAIKISFPHTKTILCEQIIDLIQNGYSLCESLQQTGLCKTPIILMRLKAADKTGDLKKALEDIIEYLEWSQSFQKNLKATIQYPLFVVGITICLSIFLISFVLPNLMELYNSMGRAIPPETLFLLKGFEFLPVIGLSFLTVSMGIFLYYKFLLRSPEGLHAVLNIAQKTGLMVSALLYFWLLIFKPLSYLYRSHRIDIVETLTFVSTLFSSPAIKSLIKQISHDIQAGSDIPMTFSEVLKLPSSHIETLRVGAETNHLKEAFVLIANHLESQLIQNINSFSTKLGPSLLVFVGSLILFLVVTIVVPLYDSLGMIS